MNWTEPKPPAKDVSFYDHVFCETPLGKFTIEWKSWKENNDYCIILEGTYIGNEYSLDKAKEFVKTYLFFKSVELSNYLEN